MKTFLGERPRLTGGSVGEVGEGRHRRKKEAACKYGHVTAGLRHFPFEFTRRQMAAETPKGEYT